MRRPDGVPGTRANYERLQQEREALIASGVPATKLEKPLPVGVRASHEPQQKTTGETE